MRGHAIRCLFVGLVIVLTITAPLRAAAQDDPPELSGKATNWIGTPPPEDCTGDAVAVADFMDAMAAGGKAETDSPVLPLQVASEDNLPTGADAEADVVEAVSATLWEATACLNAGDIARFFTLFSPAGLYQFYSGVLTAFGRTAGPFTAKELTDLETNITSSLAVTPEPVAVAERGRIENIREVRTLPDNRVLVIAEGTISGDGSAYAVLSLIEKHWLIDAIGVIGELLPATT